MEKGADEECVDASKKSALMLASEFGHDVCVLELIKAGANVEHALDDGFNSLLYAAQNGHDLCVRALLEAKASIEAVESHGMTALLFTAQNGHSSAPAH